jgi:hypothetical protein
MKSSGDFAGQGIRIAIITFTRWMDKRRIPTFAEDVAARFNVSMSTAHHWLNAFEQATGTERPRRHGGFARKRA